MQLSSLSPSILIEHIAVLVVRLPGDVDALAGLNRYTSFATATFLRMRQPPPKRALGAADSADSLRQRIHEAPLAFLGRSFLFMLLKHRERFLDPSCDALITTCEMCARRVIGLRVKTVIIHIGDSVDVIVEPFVRGGGERWQ